MNLQLIYESLIARGLTRVKKRCDGLHRHRIIPGCLGGKYEDGNVSLLTRKEHRVVHRIRYLLWKNPGDAAAYAKLGGRDRLWFKMPSEWRKNLSVAHVGQNKGMVMCKDDAGNSHHVMKEEFERRDDLFGTLKGITGPAHPRYGKPNPQFAALGRSQRGVNGTLWSGYWITPWGKFVTRKEAEEMCPETYTASTVYGYCKNPDKMITERSLHRSNFLTKQHVGMTYGDLGFGFEMVGG